MFRDFKNTRQEGIMVFVIEAGLTLSRANACFGYVLDIFMVLKCVWF